MFQDREELAMLFWTRQESTERGVSLKENQNLYQEKEKEQMLEYMEKLQEEDLRVTGLHRSCQVLPATKPSDAVGLEGVG